jgi:uncharacterized protein (DUF2235 family)
MAKKIILFSDGTGNSAAKLFKTNVWRTYQALDLSRPDQIAFYDDGVGTSSFKPLALVGSAIGFGLARNVRELYAFVCRNYEPGDQIYMFGFSRGAFTIRVVNGVIASQGIIKKTDFTDERDLKRKVKWAYRKYREKYPTPPLVPLMRRIRDTALWVLEAGKTRYLQSDNLQPFHSNDAVNGVKVEFLGLWDTVAAYGLPTDEMTLGWDRWIWPLSMSDRDIWSGVKKACHALSLDDERNTFHPVLWNEVKADVTPATRAEKCTYQDQQTKHTDEETLTQVWFAGVHANVGGGYPDDSLAHVPLRWIVNEARKTGLRFRARAFLELNRRADSLGPTYDSRHGFASYYRYLPRKLAKLTDDTKPVFDMWTRREKVDNIVRIERPKIHHSVIDKITRDGEGYFPIVLPKTYAVMMADGSIVDPGQLPGQPFETGQQADVREIIQERVWDLVWHRRVTYFATLFATLVLAALPWMDWLWPLKKIPPLNSVTGGDKCVDSLFCFASGLPKLAGSFLPGFASTWINSYSNNPGVFAFLGLILAALLFRSSRLAAAIKDLMRRIWRQQPAAVAKEFEHGKLWKLRENERYKYFFELLKFRILPFAFGFGALLLILYLPLIGASRIWFSLADARGKFCAATEVLKPVVDPTVPTGDRLFETRNPCWASGLELKEGARYRITLQIAEQPWCDSTIEADLTGNIENLPVYAALPGWPLKRYIGENYFKPVARIGHKDKKENGVIRGQDEYVLNPLIPLAKGERTDTLVSEFTAHSSGELFLYVNDAIVLFEPDWLVGTYKNNRGKARIMVERIGMQNVSIRVLSSPPVPPC